MSSRRSISALARVYARRDDELVALAVGGDHDAFVTLVRRHDPRMRALAARLLGGERDRVDDTLQEAYVRSYRALSTFRNDAEFATWLYRITYNACLDELRRNERRPVPVDASDELWDRRASTPDPDAAVSASDRAARILAAIPVDQRVAVVLIDGEGVELAEAAALLDVPPGTVASRLSRGRARIRRLMGEDES